MRLSVKKVILKWSYYEDIILCPDYVAENLQEYQEQFDIWINQPEQEKISGYNNGNRRKSVIQPFIFKMDLPGGPDRNVRLFVFYTGINISGHGTCAFPHRIQKEIL